MKNKTPLHDEHVAARARMAPFAGWAMPIQYAGILDEHHHTRTKTSVFDTCHMGEFELSGPGAEADLERLLTLRVSTIKPNQCRYGFLLNHDGGVLDDLTCYRRAPDRFLLVVNAGTRKRDAEWIRSHLSDRTQFVDQSNQTAKLDVQGPGSRAALEQALGTAVPDLDFFYSVDWDIAGLPCLLSRTGYTGEWGYELYFALSDAVRIWRQLTADSMIRPAGLGARDTLRLEVGYPLYGHELGTSRTPVAAVGRRFMDTGKAFNGRAAVLRDLENGTEDKLVALQLSGKRAAREGDPVLLDARKVGVITSGSLSPSLGTAVALAYVRADLASPGQPLNPQTRGAQLDAVVTQLPFYKDGSVRG
jgi:aminomethyltransferase